MRIVTRQQLPLRAGEQVAAKPHLVLAKVAGVDTAVFGLKDTPGEPLLFDHPRGNLLVATTKLSHFVTGRYMPEEAWRTIWQTILDRLAAGRGGCRRSHWTPTVRPSFGRDEPLPADVELQALRRSADWIVAQPHPPPSAWPQGGVGLVAHATTRSATCPAADWPAGDGSLGMLEGFSSTIRRDGSQPMRYAVRNDCTCEVAMLMALDGAGQLPAAARPDRRESAGLHLREVGPGRRTTPDPPDPAYGLVGWALDQPGHVLGRRQRPGLLGVLAAVGRAEGAALGRRRGPLPAGESPHHRRLRLPRGVHPRRGPAKGRLESTIGTASNVHYSPHFQAGSGRVSFWAYDKTHFEPFLTRTRDRACGC